MIDRFVGINTGWMDDINGCMDVTYVIPKIHMVPQTYANKYSYTNYT